MMSFPVWLPGSMFLPGGLCPGRLPVWEGLYRETPESEKRAVLILLECFLVTSIGLHILIN